MASPFSTMRRRWLPDVVGLGATLVAATFGFFLISGASLSKLSALWGRNDVVLEYSVAKWIQDGGWGVLNERLGFPSGQDWSHFPSLDALTWLEVRLLGLLFDPIATMNLLLVISFPAVAGLMYLVLRTLFVGRFLSFAGGVAISLIGYHFDYEHPILSNYWVIPLGILWLALLGHADSRVSHRSSRPSVLLLGLVLGVLIGLQTPYYVIFFLILGALTVVFSWTNSRQGLKPLGRLVVLAAPAVSFGATVLVVRAMRVIPVVAPTAERSLEESTTWGGKFMSLFAISGDSALARNPVNTRFAEALNTSTWTGVEAGHSAIVVASSAVLVCLALTLVFRPHSRTALLNGAAEPSRLWAGLWMASALLFLTSGLGLAFAALVSPQIRVWGRLSVVIAAVALTGALIFLTRLQGSLKTGDGISRFLRPALYGVVVILLLDLVTDRRPVVVDSSTLPALREVETALSASNDAACPVLSIPTVAFPEAYPKGSMQAYDHLLPYLATSAPTFSYGAMKGGLGANWTDHLAVEPAQLAAQATALGFCAVLVDTQGLDSTTPSIDQYSAAMGPARAALHERWFLFTLENVEADLTAGNIFDRPEVQYLSGFTEGKMSDDASIYRWIADGTGSLRIWNPSATERSWTMLVPLVAANCESAMSLDVRVDGQTQQSIDLASGSSGRAVIPLTLPPNGFAEVDLTADRAGCAEAGEAVPVSVRVTHPTLVPAPTEGIEVLPVSGFYAPEFDSSGNSWQWSSSQNAELVVVNYGIGDTVTLTGEMQAPPCGNGQKLTITAQDGLGPEVALASGQSQDFSVTLSVPRLRPTRVQFTSADPTCQVGDDNRLLGGGLRNLTVSPTL